MMMMYETARPLELEEDMTDRIIWEENTVFLMETDGLCLFFLALFGLGRSWAFFIWWQVGYVIHTFLSGSLQPRWGLWETQMEGFGGGVESRP